MTTSSDVSDDPSWLIHKQCEDLWKQLEQCQLDLSSSNVTVLSDAEDPMVQLYNERIELLKGEIAARKNAESVVLPNERQIQKDILRDDLEKNVSQLQVLDSVVDAQIKQLTTDTQRESEWREQHEAINTSLKAKLSKLDAKQRAHHGDRHLDELEKKEKRGQEYKNKLMSLMSDFLEEQFPLPTNEDVRKGIRKRHSSGPHQRGKTSSEGMLTLHQIVRLLMGKCLDTPYDAYITIDDTFWQPYIELLLRCRIALTHPDDVQRIKLVPFHL